MPYTMLTNDSVSDENMTALTGSLAGQLLSENAGISTTKVLAGPES
eukprot:SAG22_NODE_27_length_29018_cov_465.809646_33_plen_46_part_00